MEDNNTKDEGYQFDDAIESSQGSSVSGSNFNGSNSGGGYAKEIFSKTVHAQFRTFYIDLKESRKGKFVKISEKSQGRKSTIMMDCEDVPQIIEALKEIQNKM